MAGSVKRKIQSTEAFRRLNAFRWREKMTHPGKEFSDETFYVIRRHANRAGLFSFVMTNLGSIDIALQKGYIPVIDMQNSPNPMLEADEVGKVNAWEKFFAQPGGKSLAEISGAANVILSGIDAPSAYPDYEMLQDTEQLEHWRHLYHVYIHLLPEIELAAREYMETVFKGMRVLGVLCRGTDYVQVRPKGHPIQPDTQEVIRRCREVMKEHRLDAIYLATEDREIWEAFQEAFPGRIFSFQRMHLSLRPGENVNDIGNKIQGATDRNREYLTSIRILSMSDCFVAGAANGSYAALLMTDGFEYQYIYQLGTYE